MDIIGDDAISMGIIGDDAISMDIIGDDTYPRSKLRRPKSIKKGNLQTAISYDAAINNNNDHGHGITPPTKGVAPLPETDLWRIWGENNYKNKELNDSFGTMHIGKKYDD